MTNRPKWLLELENRKRKPRLAHEAGAGAPCTNCNSACPGLDLHFWRKICKNCKCGRDDHDVDDDEFPQFDLLFGPSGKFKKKSMCLQVNNKKANAGESTFEWVPPDTTKELAVDYMKALPMEKLPIKGSVGAVLRRQLLQKQLPLHDIDYKVCDQLSEQEQKQFERYLENIKKYVGQGKVMKMLAARPFDRSLVTPVNATDMQTCSPQHKSCIPSVPAVQLRTPSSFATMKDSSYAKHPYDTRNKRDVAAVTNNNEVQSSTEEYNCTLDNVSSLSARCSSNVARSQPIEGKLILISENEKATNGKIINSSILTHLAEQEIVPAREKHTSTSYASYAFEAHHGETPNDDTTTTRLHPSVRASLSHPEAANGRNDETAFIHAESMLADALLPPSAIHANDIVGSTLDEKGLTFIREKLADKYNIADNSGTMQRRTCSVSKSYPRPLDRATVGSRDRSQGRVKDNNNPASIDKYVETTAAIVAAATEKQPAERAEMSLFQLPFSEAERKTCKPSSRVVESTDVLASINNPNQRKPCGSLSNDDPSKVTIESTDLSSDLNSIDPTTLVPPHLPTQTHEDSQNPIDAFASNPLQIELNSSRLKSSVVHSEQLQNQAFPHIVGNFNEQCDQQQQRRYTPLTDCLKDAIENLKIDSTRVQKCEKCHEDIRIDDVIVIAEKANNASWHPGCFVCSVCNELLVDLVYFYYKNKLYCGRDLAAFLGIPRCFACDELIFVREYTVAEGHDYHVKHFCCWDCDMPLAGQQYITENDRPLCLSCYQKSYAKTCAACNVVIAADQQGVAIKNLNFHATQVCFCCYSCKKNLLNGRMAIKKDKLFCSKECIATFFH